MDYIEQIPESKPTSIDVKTDVNNVPKRLTIEYELTAKIKDISSEIKNDSEKNLPR